MVLKMNRGPRSSHWLLIFLAFFVLILDQGSKLWVLKYVDEPIRILPNFFHICRLFNDGAAWSLFSGHQYFLTGVSFLALALIFIGRKKLGLDEKKRALCFGLIVGGICGNLIDRLVYQRVIDFLDFNLWIYHWPTFNVADMAIVVGVTLFVLIAHGDERKPRK